MFLPPAAGAGRAGKGSACSCPAVGCRVGESRPARWLGKVWSSSRAFGDAVEWLSRLRRLLLRQCFWTNSAETKSKANAGWAIGKPWASPPSTALTWAALWTPSSSSGPQIPLQLYRTNRFLTSPGLICPDNTSLWCDGCWERQCLARATPLHCVCLLVCLHFSSYRLCVTSLKGKGLSTLENPRFSKH